MRMIVYIKMGEEHRHPQLMALSWFQQNRTLNETALSEGI
jgi:hypothetical protein